MARYDGIAAVSRVLCVLSALIVFALTAVPGDAAWAQAPAGRDVGQTESLSGAVPGNSSGGTSDSDFWRQVRSGAAGGLVQSQGDEWSRWRIPIHDYGGWILAVVVGVILIYFAIRGRMHIEDGRTGMVIPRFTLTQRVVHWVIAILFIILGLSGLAIMFGRAVLIPLFGKDAFAAIASLSLQAHNLFGPLFIPAIVALLITFIRGNGFKLLDIPWIFKGGGFFGGHASSEKYNFGEKSWFWWAVIMGFALSGSGLIMVWPDLGFERNVMQWANVVHAIAAILFMAVGIGHIYVGSIGIEGALEGMTRGTVDVNWAKEHHDLWYEQHADQATPDVGAAEARAADGKV